MTPSLDLYLDHWERLTVAGRAQALRLLATLEVDTYETAEHPTVSVRAYRPVSRPTQPRVEQTQPHRLINPAALGPAKPPALAPQAWNPRQTQMLPRDTIQNLLAQSEHHRCRNCGTEQPLANCCHQCGHALDLYTDSKEQTA